MKIPLKWCTAFLLHLSQAAAALGTVHLVFDAKLTLISTPPSPTFSGGSGSSSQPHLFDPAAATSFTLAQHELALPIMPLHLLGKKSWNVYNKSNIEKVRRDEAIAKAKEDADEERMQEIDARRRLAILRGEEPEPLPLPEPSDSDSPKKRRADDAGGEKRERKKRKRFGEDDTDFELRITQEKGKSRLAGIGGGQEEEDDASAIPSGRQLVLRKETTRNAPVVNAQGHIDLFPQDLPPVSHKSSAIEKKDEHAEKVRARKEKQIQDQLSLKFDNAAGYGTSLTSKAWYESSGRNILNRPEGNEGGEDDEDDEVNMIVVGKDVWGNEDPRRKEREKARVVSNDPLAMMKAGSRKVREVESERRKWREEREREMLELRNRELEESERRRRRKRKYGNEGERDVEGLIVGYGSGDREKKRKRDDDDRSEHRRHKSSGDRDRERSSKGDRGEHRERERSKDMDYRREREDERSHRRGHDEDRRHRSRHHRH